MKHLFVPYELAKLAHEGGFKEQCFAYYGHAYGSTEIELTVYQDSNEFSEPLVFEFECTLYQQLIIWFDEKHNIRIDRHNSGTTGKHRYHIWQFIDGKWEKQFNALSFFTSTERDHAGIKAAFELIEVGQPA